MGFSKRAVLMVGLAAAFAGSAVTAEPAFAENPSLHHAQSGALLAYADAATLILYATFLEKEFDPELAKTTLKELERTLNGAKKSVDRTRLMLSDAKLEPEFTKLLDIVKRAEKQLGNLMTDVEEQTGEKEKEPGAGDHRDDDEGEKEEPKRDWALLKNGAGWLYADIKDARTMHANLGKKLKSSPMKPPPKPTGKREEE